jgi:uncharacterized protein YecE (DUF72 family)
MKNYSFRDLDLLKAKMNSAEDTATNLSCKQAARTVKVGTCGFGLGKEAYARVFDCVEVQHTFYQPPQIKTLERWREEVPPNFEFTLKAWQLITHDAKSPTHRRLKRKLSDIEKQEAGYFRNTAIVDEAWQTTLASAKALQAQTILFQCPASFTPTEEHVENMERFFGAIERHDLDLCWEPRGNWSPALVKSICDRLQLVHVVDPFVAETVTPQKCYYRLHGKAGWRYQYETGELEELADLVVNREAAYVFFNNSKMTEDALNFCKTLNERE